ncbi:hypothetical protein PVAP13_3KG040300 [Panicum virgatum]|uniref:Uncharacterized protein n=1 Tax=Panicum virgatum TaxID=38727 RepID=A0A8T0UKM6_PANVG|nr:hypothetical protein PVAP13_3KG040300 [Panicum virgatum]
MPASCSTECRVGKPSWFIKGCLLGGEQRTAARYLTTPSVHLWSRICVQCSDGTASDLLEFHDLLQLRVLGLFAHAEVKLSLQLCPHKGRCPF